MAFTGHCFYQYPLLCILSALPFQSKLPNFFFSFLLSRIFFLFRLTRAIYSLKNINALFPSALFLARQPILREKRGFRNTKIYSISAGVILLTQSLP